MATVALPAVRFQIARPQVIDSVSVSRTGQRAISFVESADPYWQVTMRTKPLRAAELALVEAFREETRQGRNTVIYTPKHICVPQVYWGNPNAAALSNTGLVTSIAGHSLSFNSVDNGLTLMRGDLISLAGNGYRALCRIITGAIAAGNAMTVTVEPAVPGYMIIGSVVRFKIPELNMRVLPGSFSIPDDFRPVASFTLVEVPK
jgi:hypothetical protein